MKQEFSQVVKLVTKEIVTQQVIINGVPQEITQPTICVVCPTCGKVFFNFQPGIPELDCYRAIAQDRDKLNDGMPYCSNCGQKLSWNFDIFDSYEVK